MKARLCAALALLFVSLSAAAEPSAGPSIPKGLIVLTFDDSVASHATFVAPLLKKLGFGATFFITEGFEFATDKEHYMTWEQIKGLHEAGFEIGNHTRRHASVVKQSPEQLSADIEFMESQCLSHGIPRPVSFCYPGYQSSETAVKVLAERGYKFARAGGARAFDPATDNFLTIPQAFDSKPGVALDQLKAAVALAKDGKIAVLTFHGVPDIKHPWVDTDPAKFESYMAYLKAQGCRVIAMRDLEKFTGGKSTSATHWPQAAGPNGSWSVDVPAEDVPVAWSVAKNEHIKWRTTLPEEGQSGIAVWGDYAFLTIYKPEKDKLPNGKDILGYCLNAKTGAILWTVEIPGTAVSIPAYFFADATSPTPVTDGRHVWFTNAFGGMGCCDFAGKLLWTRQWTPTGNRPPNKLFEPILTDGALLSLEPRDPTDPKRESDPWNYIRGLDKLTGKTLWVSDDALTHYNTPVMSRLADGTPALLMGRGGYHDVPEAPIGLSLVSLAPGHEGRTLWRFAAEPKGKALYVQHWNAKYAFWINQETAEHQVLDAATGKLLRTQPLMTHADWRRHDPATGKYQLLADVDFTAQTPPIKVFPAQLCNMVLGRWHWFLCYAEEKKHIGPAYCVARVNIETGKTEYLEVPVSVTRVAGRADSFIWGQPQSSSTINSRGIDIATDKRSKGDGWWWGYLGSPTAAGGKIFFTTMLGITYVLDGNAAVLDEKALLSVNDLGPPPETWSLNSVSYADHHLFHRSMKEVVCIGD